MGTFLNVIGFTIEAGAADLDAVRDAAEAITDSDLEAATENLDPAGLVVDEVYEKISSDPLIALRRYILTGAERYLDAAMLGDAVEFSLPDGGFFVVYGGTDTGGTTYADDFDSVGIFVRACDFFPLLAEAAKVRGSGIVLNAEKIDAAYKAGLR